MDASGELVAFSSLASNLVAGNTNDEVDVFLRSPDGMRRVSVTSGGQQSQDSSFQADLSQDGRRVVFVCDAPHLACQHCDTNNDFDIYLRDLTSAVTVRISVGEAGDEPDGPGFEPSISADGNLVAVKDE